MAVTGEKSVFGQGFLFFFGPLSIAKSFEGAWDTERHKVLRYARGFAGVALLCAWLVVVGALVSHVRQPVERSQLDGSSHSVT